jgi:3-dehydroquinate synthase
VQGAVWSQRRTTVKQPFRLAASGSLRTLETVVPVELGARSYEVVVSGAGWKPFAERLRRTCSGKLAFVLSDSNVAPHYLLPVRAALLDVEFEVVVHTIPAGEASKTLAEAGSAFDPLVEANADRKTVVVGLGGGVVTDLAGFVAATYARGVAFVPVPTTLLAMVDASVGGKVAVDHPKAKNIIGAFHQPSLVWCNLEALQTLPDRAFRCGLAEAVKHGFALSEPYLETIERDADRLLIRDKDALRRLVEGSVRLKASIVAEDERETSGRRSLLNFGHTFGHAFEVLGGFTELEHGEAVSVGMCCAAELAHRSGRVGVEYNERLRAILNRLGLPTVVPARFSPFEALTLMRGDKKSEGGAIRLVLPTGVGSAELVGGVEASRIVEAIAACQSPKVT